jgi:hypothetical protein
MSAIVQALIASFASGGGGGGGGTMLADNITELLKPLWTILG